MRAPATPRSTPRRWPWRRLALASVLGASLLAGGCAALDEQQRRWIFQPSKGTWGGQPTAADLQDVWIHFQSRASGKPVRLHGLWLPQARADAPVLLYLHGARWNVASSTGRMRRLHALGFSVLGVDYRGFGQSTDVLPSEDFAHEDAAAAWAWLAQQAPQAKRYVYGHSLGGTIAVRLAAEGVAPEQTPDGLMLEGTFTSIPELVNTFRFGWLPLRPLISQRFDAGSRIAQLRMPLLVVHGREDQLVPAELGQALFDKATAPKRLLLVDGGTHHNASRVGFDALREAVAALYGVSAGPTAPN
jgi:alpha-beta hydrolase superfamily lysophospholipase